MSQDRWILTSRGVLHRGALTETGTLLTPEACNLDQAVLARLSWQLLPDNELPARYKRQCRRCFG